MPGRVTDIKKSHTSDNIVPHRFHPPGGIALGQLTSPIYRSLTHLTVYHMAV